MPIILFLFSLGIAIAQDAEEHTPMVTGADAPRPTVSDYAYALLCRRMIDEHEDGQKLAQLHLNIGNLRTSEDPADRYRSAAMNREAQARAADLTAQHSLIIAEIERLKRTYPDDVRKVNVHTCRTTVKLIESEDT